MNKAEQKRHLKVARARKNVEKRIRHLQNAKKAAENRISATEARIQCLDDPKWIADYVQREKEIATTSIQNLSADKHRLQDEIAGLQIELARHKNREKQQEKETA